MGMSAAWRILSTVALPILPASAMLRIDSPCSYLAVTSPARLAVTRVRTYGRELANRDGSDAGGEASAERHAMFNETRLRTTKSSS